MKKEEKKELEAKEESEVKENKKDKTDKKGKKDKKEKKSKKKNKDLTPEEREAKVAGKVVATKCIAAIICAVIVALSMSSAFSKLAEAAKETASASASASSTASETSEEEEFFGDDLATDAPVADSGDTSTDAPAADSGDVSTDAPAADANGGDSANAPAADNKADDTANKKPSTTAEIIAYFNTAANKVKTSAKSVQQKEVTNYLASPTTIPSGIQGVYKMLGGDSWLDETLKKESQGAATYTGADIKAKFPVEGESWSSKLEASDVKGASCTEANGVYTIKIMTKADAKSDSIKHGQGYNPKAFNVILPGVINENIPGVAKSLVGTASMNYPASTIVATVDVKTGNLLSANYDLKWTINFDKMGIILPFGTRSNYTINW